MRVLLKFSRTREIKYISHLDIQRLFHRALRRAKVPVAYSQGFNPHMVTSFASALPLGVCSESEYAEISLEKYMHPEDVKSHLNEVLPEGIKIIKAVELNDNYPTVASVIALAGYTLSFEDAVSAQRAVEQTNAQKEIFIEKKTKKGLATVDVRRMIHSLVCDGEKISATLSLSNSESLRADKLAEILENNGAKINGITRNAIFIIKDGCLEEPIR